MPNDKLGREIKVASYIVYSRMQGYSSVLGLGRILSINDKVRKNTDQKYTTFTIIAIEDGWGNHEPQLMSKKVTLQFADRMVVLNPEMVAPIVKKLIDDYQF